MEGSFSFYAGQEELIGQVSTTVRVVAGEDRVELPTGAFLGADFARAGFDLLLDAGSDGSVVIPDYFLRLSPPDLVTADGAVLPHHIVRALAGPMNPGQVAQAFPLGGNPGASLGLGEPIGSVSESQGAVSVLHPDGTQVMLETGDAIFQGDVIETGPDGSVNVIFVDDTVFSLDVDGRMVMDEMVYDPGSETGTFNTMVVQGVFSFVSGKVAKTSPDGMVVNTPTATIGIRGSTVLGNAAAEGAENKITLVRDVDGNVGEIVISNAAGSLVLNQAGASTTVFSASANPSPIQILSQSQIQTSFGGSLTKLVKTVAKQAEQKAVAAQTAAADAKDAAATAKADADAAKADADAQKAEADQAAEDAAAALADAQETGNPEAIAKAEAAAAAAAEAQAKAAAAAEAAAQAEAAAAAAAAAAAQAATQADQAAAFSSLASTAVDVQVSAETAAAQDNAAEQSQTSTTSTSGTSSTADTANTADTADTTNTADTTTEGDGPVDVPLSLDTLPPVDDPFLVDDPLLNDPFLDGTDGLGFNNGFNSIPGTAGDDTFLPGDDTDDTPIQTPVSTVNTPPTIFGVEGDRSGLQFDGVDDYVEISDAHYNNLSAGTVEVWLYVPDFSSSNIVLAKQDDGVNTMGVLGLGGAGGGAATSATDGVVTWHGNNTGGTAVSTGTITAGAWQHVAVTFSNTQVKFYINGVLDSTTMGDYSIPNDVNGTVRTTLGSLIESGSPTEALGGMMTELRIWNVERSATEISNNYSSPLASPDTETSLIGYWPLDTVATGVADDFSVNADAGLLGDGTPGNASEPTEVLPDVTIALNEDTSFSGTIVAFDANNDPITYGVDTDPTNGTVTMNADGSFTYTPTADFNGTDSFVVSASDGTDTTTSTVTVNVAAVNDAPVLSDVTVAGTEDQVVNGAVTGTDADGDTITYAQGTGPSNGSVTVNADGTFAYTPTANFNGADSFTVTGSDSNGGTATSTVTVNVAAVNDAPVLSDVTVAGTEDQVVNGAVTGTDADGDTITYAQGTGPSNGSVTVNADGTFAYTPTANFNGADSFTVTGSDSNGGTATSTVTVNVAAVDDTPVAGGTFSESVFKGGTIIFANTHLNATDIDTTNSSLTYTITAVPASGTVKLNGANLGVSGTFTQADVDAGNVSYIHNNDAATNDSFTFTVTDGTTTTSVQTVNLTINSPYTITGSANDEIIFGDTGNDTLASGGGNDIIIGGAGADSITLSGVGSETVVYSATTDGATATNSLSGRDVIYGYTQGTDKIGISGSLATTLDDVGAADGSLSWTTGAADFTGTHEAMYVADTTNNFATQMTQSGVVTLLANLMNTAGVTSAAGDDALITYSANGANTGYGGGLFYFQENGTTVNNVTADELTYIATIDSTALNSNLTLDVSIVADNSVVRGTAGNDTITGSANNETILAGAGDDTIDSGGGNDIIVGGAGADSITLNTASPELVVYSAATDGAAVTNSLSGRDIIYGYTQGTDKIGISGTLATALDDVGAADGSLTWATGAANFTGTHEAMYVADTTNNFATQMTQSGVVTLLANLMNTAGVTSAAGDDALIAYSANGANTGYGGGLFYFQENGTALNNVTADELTYIATIDSTALNSNLTLDVSIVADPVS